MSGNSQSLCGGGRGSHLAQPGTSSQLQPRTQREGAQAWKAVGWIAGARSSPCLGHGVIGNKPILAPRGLAVPWAGLGNPKVGRGGPAPRSPQAAGRHVAPKS